MEHLVYCDTKAKVLSKLLDSSKTMIIRGAAGRKLPHSRVFTGETLYFIQNNSDVRITAKAKVKSVFNSEKMTEEQSAAVIKQYENQLNLSPEQLNRWSGKKFLCIVEVENVALIEPMILERQSNMDDWITVNSINEIVKTENCANLKYNNVRLNSNL